MRKNLQNLYAKLGTSARLSAVIPGRDLGLLHADDLARSQYIGVKGCTDGSQTGAAIGAALVVVLWMVVDVILGVSYGVY